MKRGQHVKFRDTIDFNFYDGLIDGPSVIKGQYTVRNVNHPDYPVGANLSLPVEQIKEFEQMDLFQDKAPSPEVIELVATIRNLHEWMMNYVDGRTCGFMAEIRDVEQILKKYQQVPDKRFDETH